MKSKQIQQFIAGGALLAIAAGHSSAQTQVDLRTQSKSVDFSAASSTKVFQSGAILPATCALGQTFFKTNATAGANYYACTSTNTWTLESGNATQIQSRSVSGSAPADGQGLVWSASGNTWRPALRWSPRSSRPPASLRNFPFLGPRGSGVERHRNR